MQFKPNTFYNYWGGNRIYILDGAYSILPEGAGYAPFSDIEWIEANMSPATLTYPL